MKFKGTKKGVGKYEIGQILGKGYSSVVVLGRQIHTGKLRALKTFQKVDDKEQQSQLLLQVEHEIYIMQKLKHPNIVQLLDFFQSERHIYLVLELQQEGALSEKILIGATFLETEARRYFQQLLSAIRYCHLNGICHRDIKPCNLLLDTKDNLKLGDFGLSAIITTMESTDVTLGVGVCGTLEYMAPEVIIDKGYDGNIADVWSCGVVLFELLTSTIPFQGETTSQIHKEIINAVNAEYEMPSTLSPGAVYLIRRLLTLNPVERITIAEIFENEWFKQDYRDIKSKGKAAEASPACLIPYRATWLKSDNSIQEMGTKIRMLLNRCITCCISPSS